MNIKKKEIKIYLCGLTPYSEMHVGHARVYVYMDFFIRATNLHAPRAKIRYISNFTDIDEKITSYSISQKVPEKTLVQNTVFEFFKFFFKFNLIKPTKFYYVSKNINLINEKRQLIPREYLFETEKEILFDLDSFFKKNPTYVYEGLDKKSRFLVWDKEKKLPGWHTECFSFIHSEFNADTIDIHVSGSDLKFPHNENEKIQFFAVEKKKLSDSWIHVGVVTNNGKKMSKSKKNHVPLSKFFKHPNNIYSLKFFFLMKKITKPIEFSFEQLEEDKKILEQKYALITSILKKPIFGPSCPSFASWTIEIEEAFSLLEKYSSREGILNFFNFFEKLRKKEYFSYLEKSFLIANVLKFNSVCQIFSFSGEQISSFF